MFSFHGQTPNFHGQMVIFTVFTVFMVFAKGVNPWFSDFFWLSVFCARSRHVFPGCFKKCFKLYKAKGLISKIQHINLVTTIPPHMGTVMLAIAKLSSRSGLPSRNMGHEPFCFTKSTKDIRTFKPIYPSIYMCKKKLYVLSFYMTIYIFIKLLDILYVYTCVLKHLDIFEIRLFRGFMYPFPSSEYKRPGSSVFFFTAHSVSNVSAPYIPLQIERY